ncbi:LytR family transcriptional regulator [bacterium]|nr:LytR family transcriptional regulator [bacterium]NBX97604.1 LytR family transcriptional regulator [bacterium]NDC94559.1 LytR family transcriptional regulator [bacterium]NDD84146.1 LytR family transcriptional regulator [bacterium]NDG29967.1 LytR family transcriptional regulator [bacterium]
MDNFKQPKRSYQRGRGVDGFVSRSQKPQQHTPVATNFKKSTNSQLKPVQSTEGYAPSTLSLTPRQDSKAPLGGPTVRPKKARRSAKPKRSLGKKIFRASVALFTFAFVLVGGIAGYTYFKTRLVFSGSSSGAVALQKNVDPVKLKGEGDGRVNVLLLGLGGEGQDGAYLTDTIIVASIDPVQNEAALLSVPRDLWVKKSSGSAGKINEVYANARESSLVSSKDKEAANKAGVDAIEKVLTEVLGIKLDYSVVADFKGFIKAVDAVGGVQINITPDLAVTEQLYDSVNKKPYFLDVKEGLQNFDSTRALYFSRSRYTSTRGDFDRSQRQRALIVALKEKVQSAGTYSNPVKVTQLLSTLGDNVRTDLSINEVMRLYEIGKNITPDKVASVSLVDKPNILIVSESINGLSTQVPKAGLFNYTDIQSFVRNSLKDAFIKKENATVTVLNGTSTEGLATRRATELRSFGYNVLSTGNAPNKNYTKTVLVDLRSGSKKYTKNYLEKRFGVAAVTQLPDPSIVAGDADFVIILGTDSIAATQ